MLSSTRTRSKSEVPSSRRISFDIHEIDSSDGELPEPVPREPTKKNESWDLETLYEFDIDTLVNLARGATCNVVLGPANASPLGTPGPREYQLTPSRADVKTDAVMDCPPAVPELPGTRDSGTAADDEVQRLRRECAMKDQEIERRDAQIESLRRVVCEMLSWGGVCPGVVPFNKQTVAKVEEVLPRSSPNAYVPPYRRLRPGAPEFVPLGLMPEPNPSASSTSRRAQSAAATSSAKKSKSQKTQAPRADGKQFVNGPKPVPLGEQQCKPMLNEQQCKQVETVASPQRQASRVRINSPPMEADEAHLGQAAQRPAVNELNSDARIAQGESWQKENVPSAQRRAHSGNRRTAESDASLDVASWPSLADSGLGKRETGTSRRGRSKGCRREH